MLRVTFMSLFSCCALLFGCKQSDLFRSVDAATFAEMITNPAIQLVDVRTPAEYAEGYIPGAKNMDVNSEQFDRQIETLDKERPVALYCRSGRRSKMAAERVAKAGYEVIELDGGILSWKGTLER